MGASQSSGVLLGQEEFVHKALLNSFTVRAEPSRACLSQPLPLQFDLTATSLPACLLPSWSRPLPGLNATGLREPRP
jgi:hypothetical protein